jgi:hypothetical protein
MKEQIKRWLQVMLLLLAVLAFFGVVFGLGFE